MSQDQLSKLLSRLDELANITPTSVRHGLNKQQRRAPQLPAEFQPGQISVLANRTDPEHPARRYFVGAESKGAELQDTGEPFFVALVTRDARPRVQRTRTAMPMAQAQALAKRLATTSKFARKPFVTIYPQGEGRPSAEELLTSYQNLAEDQLSEFVDTGGPDSNDDIKKQVLEMYFEDGLKEQEIGKILGLSTQQVHQILHDYEQGHGPEHLDELKRGTVNDYLSLASAAVRTGARQEKPKVNPVTGRAKPESWKVAAGKIAPAGSDMARYAKVKATNESRADEDRLSNIKKRLGDYLADVAQAIKQGDVLGDKNIDARDLMAAKTITTDDGKVIQIRGNEDDGFRIAVKDRVSETVFTTISEAETAVRLYQSRCGANKKDYMEER
jgi:hypothetical protein